ncbi:hypothetical protein TSL6_20670 [Sulfurovum sp. TSL6]|uniref:DUF5676 family membrane protein n=1 Tax=Sulfurovum sp. TSL6 TaxID=2826995 RepID=UPI001CC6D099|nr:DUF5676 family membrane protein [Sulfurovum sp. TSL6]GIU01561.1 hypothetical protein TSL6_20670 [Sulfurovum sp. TSL6]
MNINAKKIGVSSAISFGILWIICSALVHFFPDPTMMITEYMLHADLSEIVWTLTFSSFSIGLLAWSTLAGISAWLIASIYNRL